MVPANGDEVVSRQGEVVDRDKFERMKGEYYELRKWNADSGLQTPAVLRELELGDIAREMPKQGLADTESAS